MELIREQLHQNGLKDQEWQKDQARERALREALMMQRDTFQHFVTLTFAEPLSPAEATARTLSALYALQKQIGAHLKHFATLSLDQKYQWRAADDMHSESDELVTHWHVHMLVSGLGDAMTLRQIEQFFQRQSFGETRALHADGAAALMEYCTDSWRGNRVGKLQFTNDRTIRTHMTRAGHRID
jgi:hypothetical protein